MVRLSIAVLLVALSGHAARAQAPAVPLPPGSDASAQSTQNGKGSTEEVTIAIFEDFSKPGLSAVMRRTKGRSGKVLIAVKRSALSVELLNAVIQSVPNGRASARADAERNDRYFREGINLPRVAPKARAELNTTLSELLAAAPTDVPGFGKHQAVTRVF
ncbi:hypothetical protein BH09GEM1_BH09GEM1_45220 [soil metagenome]